MLKKWALVSLVLGLVFVGAFGCSSAAKRTSPSEPALAVGADGDIPVVDVHTHTVFSGKKQIYSGIEDSLPSYLESMKRAHVVAAVSHRPRDTSPFQDLSAHGVIQCYGVDFEVNPAKVEAGLKTGQFKCIKIYLGYIFRYPYDAQYKKLYRLAQKYNVPVVFHTGDTYTKDAKLKYADPLAIDEVAVEFPKVTFVIAHLGNPWIESAAEVAYKDANVYVEASALLIGKFDEIPAEKSDEYVVKPIRWAFGYIEDQSKVMFGTDWPLSDMKPYVDLYKKAIPREAWCDVFFNNAVRVFHLKTTETCKN